MENGASPISRSTIIIALVCSAAVLAVGQAMLYWRGFQQQESNRWVTRTYQVLQEMAAVRAGLACAETAVNLASMGDTNVALPLDGCITRARRGYANALRLIADETEEDSRWRAIAPLLEQRIAMLQSAFTRGTDQPNDELGRRAGVRLTSQIYAGVNVAMRNEQRTLELRLRESAEQAKVVRNMSISAAACSLVLVVLAFWLFSIQNRRLREMEAQRRLILNNAPIGMVIVSLDGRLLRANHAMCKMVGYRAEELQQQSIRTLSDQHDLEEFRSLTRKLIKREVKSVEVTRQYRHRDGHMVCAIVTVSLLRDNRGRPSFYIAQVQDISGRVQAEAQANLFFERSLDMLAIFDKHGAFERVNRTWSRVLGWPASDLLGRRFIDFVHPEDKERTIEEFETGTKAQGSLGFRNRYQAHDGSIRWLEWSASPIADERLFGIARDVTKQIELEEAIRQASLVDELTGLNNRRGFMLIGEQQLRSSLRYQRPVFLLFADLNGLKQINDQLGHEAGDRAIVEMAEVIRATFRSSDVAARLGGDEFVVLAEGDTRVADALEQRLTTATARHNAEPGRAYELSASVGVAFYDEAHACTLTELIASADKLMYEAKRRLRVSTA